MRRSPDTTSILSKAETLYLGLTPDEPIQANVDTQRQASSPRYDVHLACEVGFVLAGKYRRLYEGFERKLDEGVCLGLLPCPWPGTPSDLSILSYILYDIMCWCIRNPC